MSAMLNALSQVMNGHIAAEFVLDALVARPLRDEPPAQRPTEESVRRAMAIQLIINREWGLAKNENPSQGASIIDEVTELVEEAVLNEFEKIAERGGVLGAMETSYQRGQIQEESMHYEMLKHTGEYPIVGVNTFRNPHGDPVPEHIELGAFHRRGEAVAARAAG